VSSSLLITKLYFPTARPTLVARPRLVKCLETGLRGPLTLIAAPAGYGKTTLLSEWRAGPGADAAVAWLSLDEGDNDLPRFLLYLTAAFETVQPGLLPKTSLLVQAQELPPAETICTALINELSAFADDLILALDDYHVITNPQIHPILAFLLDHLPPHLHLAILTRADPPLPLARLRARGHLAEIRAANLRFTDDEAATFLNEVMSLNLKAEEITALEARTEGWIAALQLAALSMQNRDDTETFVAAFSGSHQYIVDYLVEEVLNRQPERIREFLLKTSILERLTAPLCEALTGIAEGQPTLERLAASNLFLIPLDDERRWFRYHHLFADLLRNQLKIRDAEQLPYLHGLASAWFDQHQIANEAIEHAFAAQDYEEVRRLMRGYFPAWWGHENWARALQWFDKFPKSFLHAEPWLCVVYAWMVWSRGKLETTEEHLSCAQKALIALKTSSKFPTDDLEYTALEAEILAFQALIATRKNDPQQVITLANRSLEVVPEESNIVRALAYNTLQIVYRDLGDIDKAIQVCRLGLPAALAGGQIGIIATSYNLLGVTLTVQGQLNEAKATYQEALAYIESVGMTNSPAFSLIRLRLADLHYQWNQLKEAENLIREGLDHVDFFGNYWSMIYGRFLLCLIYLARGETQEAQRAWEEIEGILPKIVEAYYAEEIDHILVLAKIRLGIQEKSTAFEKLELDDLKENLTTTRIENLIRQAHYLVAQNQENKAQVLLAILADITGQRNNQFWVIEILILRAICSLRLENREAAHEFFEKALHLAEPEGYLRIFLDEGEPVRELLHGIQLKDDTLKLYARKLLATFGYVSQTQAARQRLIAPLSQRELEVLGLIAAGRSNKEIATELVIALGTVKRHTVNIFNKLDVRNRTEAVAKARELGLI
jgi:LuxR family maltose regulon positive regulatory protein